MMRAREHRAASLDDRIADARNRLQRTPESHPEFERRLLDLIHLVDERDALLAARYRIAPAHPWHCRRR